MKPFLLLSKQRAALIAHCLQSSESKPPHILPELHINRQLAREHRANPALDPSCRKAVFTQVRSCHAPRQVPASSASLAPAASHPLCALLLSSCTKASDIARTMSPWTTGRSSRQICGVLHPWSGLRGYVGCLFWRRDVHGAVVSPQVAPELQPVVEV